MQLMGFLKRETKLNERGIVAVVTSLLVSNERHSPITIPRQKKRVDGD